jgi:hypothetical protein
MKSQFAGVLGGFQSLDSDDFRERPVDRLGALGAAQIARADEALRLSVLTALGVDLIRYKFAGVDTAGKDAEDKLSAALSWPKEWPGRNVLLDAAQRDVVARWSVHEWRNDKCPPRPDGCGGALEVPSSARLIDGAQPMMVCPKCRGTGWKRWSDEERRAAMEDTFSKAMGIAHALIAHAEDLAMKRGKEQVERW